MTKIMLLYIIMPSSSTISSNSKKDLENPKDRMPFKERISELNNMMNDESIVRYDADCLRKRMNWSKVKKEYNLIDNQTSVDPQLILDDLRRNSPKLYTLMKKIEELDESDMKNENTLYKHMIFTDMKTSAHGVKAIASVLAAKGLKHGYKATPNPEYDPKKKNKKFNKIRMLSNEELQKNKHNNFYILSSVDIYDQPLNVSTKKSILDRYNERPDNIYGKNVRFIIMDSGFKEGIDLYDIKYTHIFEPQTTAADQKQVIGRGTRTCGQKGLRFHPTKGWPLHVNIYDMSIPEEVQEHFGGMENTFDLYMKSLNLDMRLYNFVNDIEEATIKGSVDYDLNRNIHTFKIGGGGTKKKNSNSLPEIDDAGSEIGFELATKLLKHRVNLGSNQELSHRDDMRIYINRNFSKYKWDKAKMENLCETEKGGGKLLTYTPTQGFIKEYFTPQSATKGMILWHSTGSGKTCSAIATASNEFEKQGYTILWVTRTTLKNDIWKNMFDMVCHEVLRSKITDEGLVIPSQLPKRMQLLSNSWRIRPMSYKQFSNLVSKKNSNYDRLIKINGEQDPLKNTLIIVDEAHKLYGGGDLSSLERPDMKAFHKSLMNSYEVSGKDSVKLMLMTATPITTDPMEIVKLVNLCKPIDRQLPTHFDDFTKKYLNPDTTKFTPTGLKKYYDDISGIVSYLNREKDARQFAQPIINHIKTPLVDIRDVYDYDLRILKQQAAVDVEPFKKQIDKLENLIKRELQDIDPNMFISLQDLCKNNPYILENKKLAEQYAKKCSNTTKKHMRNVAGTIKQHITKIRGIIKELRNSIKKVNDNKTTNVNEIKNIMVKNPEKWEKFKDSVYYNIRYKCGKNIKSNIPFDEMVKTHMDIIPYMEAMHDSDEKIKELKEILVIKLDSYKNKVNELKTMIKDDDLNKLEKSVVRTTIKEYNKINSKLADQARKSTEKAITIVDKEKIKHIANKNKTMKKLKLKLKDELKREKKDEKDFLKKSRQTKKILRKTGEYKDVINNDLLKETVENERIRLEANLDTINIEFEKKFSAEREKKLVKLAKEEKMKKKKEEIVAKKLVKEQENNAKKLVKEQENNAKKLVKEQKKIARAEEQTRKKREQDLKKKNKTVKKKSSD
jgi:hypothetical protein